jgi:NADH-quinone oxidoreductase subunit A
MDPVLIAGYIALFVAIGAAFLGVNLILGWLVRPTAPNTEKLEVYECGEPTIGSSFVQFDLRFYVVALLFIIFDVEVALFFPWATVFGKATQLSDPSLVTVVEKAGPSGVGSELSPAALGLFRELGFRDPVVEPTAAAATVREEIAATGRKLAGTALVDMAAFFAILLVGFAYVWHRGDLDWVRAVSAQRGSTAGGPSLPVSQPSAGGARPVLTG